MAAAPPMMNDTSGATTSIPTGLLPTAPSYGGTGMTTYGSAGLSMPASPYLVPPSYQPYNGPATPRINPTNPGTFNTPAPTPTPYGAFNAPDPNNFTHSPDFDYLMGQEQKAIQRSAAARGTLLTGGTLQALNKASEGLASGDYQNQFNRELGAYTANRDTNAQNFGQQLGSFNAGLGAFGANTNATLGFNAQKQNADVTNYDLADEAARRAWQDQNARNAQLTDFQQLNNASEFARQVAASKAANDAITAQQQRMAQTRISRPVSAWG